MAEHWKADDVLHEKSGELVIAGGDGDDSKVSVCSSTSSLMGEDDHDEAESSLMVVADPTTMSSSFTTQLAEEHQLDVLSPLLAKLSVRYMELAFFRQKFIVHVPNHHIFRILAHSKSIRSVMQALFWQMTK